MSLHTQKGYAALIGLLMVILIIALIVYGGSFFSKKDTKPMAQTYIDVEKKAKTDIGDIEKINKSKQKEMEQVE